MSAISTLTAAPTKQFRMALPKTPDRVDSKIIGKNIKKQDSLAFDSAIGAHHREYGRENINDDDAIS